MFQCYRMFPCLHSSQQNVTCCSRSDTDPRIDTQVQTCQTFHDLVHIHRPSLLVAKGIGELRNTRSALPCPINQSATSRTQEHVTRPVSTQDSYYSTVMKTIHVLPAVHYPSVWGLLEEYARGIHFQLIKMTMTENGSSDCKHTHKHTPLRTHTCIHMYMRMYMCQVHHGNRTPNQ